MLKPKLGQSSTKEAGVSLHPGELKPEAAETHRTPTHGCESESLSGSPPPHGKMEGDAASDTSPARELGYYRPARATSTAFSQFSASEPLIPGTDLPINKPEPARGMAAAGQKT